MENESLFKSMFCIFHRIMYDRLLHVIKDIKVDACGWSFMVKR